MELFLRIVADKTGPLQFIHETLEMARAEEEGSQLVVREQQASRTVVSLVRGRASFAVVKNPQRLFRVEAGPIAVEVLGTRFSVERLGVEGLPGAQARVTVSEFFEVNFASPRTIVTPAFCARVPGTVATSTSNAAPATTKDVIEGVPA